MSVRHRYGMTALDNTAQAIKTFVIDGDGPNGGDIGVHDEIHIQGVTVAVYPDFELLDLARLARRAEHSEQRTEAPPSLKTATLS